MTFTVLRFFFLHLKLCDDFRSLSYIVHVVSKVLLPAPLLVCGVV